METMTKILKKEERKLSKREKKARADANWVGKGQAKAPQVFRMKNREYTRPNIGHMYRRGDFD